MGQSVGGVPGYSGSLASIISVLLCSVSESSLIAGGRSSAG